MKWGIWWRRWSDRREVLAVSVMSNALKHGYCLSFRGVFLFEKDMIFRCRGTEM